MNHSIAKIKKNYARATFQYTLGNATDQITVATLSNAPKNEYDWMVALGIEAAIRVSKDYQIDDFQAVNLSLTSFEMKDKG